MSSKLDTLWYTRCPVPTGLGIAVQKGWLEAGLAAQGTRIQSLRDSDDRSVRESHFDHTLENSVRHGGNIPAIWARASGRRTKLLGLSWADEVQLILTTPDSGISKPADLKGRRFGLPKWQNAQIDFSRAQAIRGLENALKLESLSVADVELVDLVITSNQSEQPVRRSTDTNVFGARGGGRNAELRGLLRGEVDAIFLKGAHAAQFSQAFDLVSSCINKSI
jgi:ABC-type nitrate/sulfonate/bicarbonate transport system substrate-binding protein